MNDKRAIEMAPTRKEEQNDDLGPGAGGGIFIRSRSKIALGLIMFAGYCLLYLAPLPFRPLHIPDETRYAEIPREMVESGDWVVPRLNGLRYFEKPVLGYWLTALSIRCFGENRFSLRLPSALATGLSAMILAWLVYRYGQASSAWLGATVFLTSFQVYALGVFNALDPVFSFLVTASLVCFYIAFQTGPGRTKKLWLALFGLACGLGFLTKGFLAFAMPAVTIGPFLVLEKRWKDMFTLPWIPLGLSLAVILPWAILIHLREPDYWRHFISVEHLERFASPDNKGLHSNPFWFLLPYLIGGAVPWTFAVPAALRGLRNVGWRDSLIRYALCWFMFPFLLVSASKGKLGTYILPCLAPVSLLIAAGLTQSMKEGDFKPFRAAAWTCAAIAGLAGPVITAIHFLNLARLPIFASDETWKWIVGAAALVAWCAISLVSARAKRMALSVGLFGVAPVALMLSAHFILPRQGFESRFPGAAIARYAEAIHREDRVYSTNYLAPAVGWTLKRTDIGILGRGGELQYGLNYPDATGRQIQIPELTTQIDDRKRSKEIILLVDDRRYSRLIKDLPEATRLEKAGGLVFATFEPRTDRSGRIDLNSRLALSQILSAYAHPKKEEP